nr:hypothetical protein Iba_chr13bCG10450 [Ipomoea batatas]
MSGKDTFLLQTKACKECLHDKMISKVHIALLWNYNTGLWIA